jgi:hypothetical protein
LCIAMNIAHDEILLGQCNRPICHENVIPACAK